MTLADKTHTDGYGAEMIFLHRHRRVGPVSAGSVGESRSWHNSKRGCGMCGEGETSWTPCPLECGYIRVEDPLWPDSSDGERPSLSRDRTSMSRSGSVHGHLAKGPASKVGNLMNATFLTV
jgi:hypothetical protein